MTDTGRSNPQRLFLTGEPGCGKTTVVRRTAELLTLHGLKVGGMTTSEIRKNGARVGFGIENMLTHEHGILAGLGPKSGGPRVGRYYVNLTDLEEIGVGAIQRAIDTAEVIILDELGPMELHSQRFVDAVERSLASPKHLLATIHKRAQHSLILQIRSNPTSAILEVTTRNRDNLSVDLVNRLVAT